MGLLRRFYGTESPPDGAPVDHSGPWERLAAEHPHHGPGEDSAELKDIDPHREEPTDIDGVTIAFQYVDVSGEATKRTLMIRRCSRSNGNIYVAGRCLLRDQYRTFRADRMSDVVEVRSRQPIDDPCAYFAKYASASARPLRKARTSEVFAGKLGAAYGPGDRLADARRICLDGIRVLAYVVILRETPCTAEDKAVETGYIGARLTDCGMGEDQALISDVLKFALAIAVPTQAFNASLKILATDQRNLGLVIAQLTKVSSAVSNEAQRLAVNQVLAAANGAARTAQE